MAFYIRGSNVLVTTPKQSQTEGNVCDKSDSLAPEYTSSLARRQGMSQIITLENRSGILDFLALNHTQFVQRKTATTGTRSRHQKTA